MEKAYAAALWHTVEKGTDPKEAVERLCTMLERRGHQALLAKIGRAFEALARQSARHTKVELVVARESDAQRMLDEAGKKIEEMGATKKDVVTRVDETLIGGWRLEGRGRLIDASYKNGLMALYERIIRT